MSSTSSADDVAAPPAAAAPAAAAGRKVWDLPVRIVHWALVAGVLASYVTSRIGPEYFRLHLAAGYLVTVLVAFRLLWGLFGTRHARFANFVRGPHAVFAHARRWLRGEPARHAGHNPLGAWMVLALLAGLAVQAGTGLFANDEIFNVGPLYGWVSDSRSLALTAIHQWLFNALAVAIAVHVLAVLAHRLLSREHLVRALWTGRKPADAVPADQAIGSSRLGVALLLLAIVLAALTALVLLAPDASLSSFDS